MGSRRRLPNYRYRMACWAIRAAVVRHPSWMFWSRQEPDPCRDGAGDRVTDLSTISGRLRGGAG